MSERARVLVLGYGNPGRGDDGLGPALVAALEVDPPDGATLASNYQLTVEDGMDVAAHEVAIFVDAATSGAAPLAFTPVAPAEAVSFSSHHVSPGSVLALARTLFGARTRAYTLAIRGYEFDAFREALSPAAAENLAASVAFLRRRLDAQDYEAAVIGPAEADAACEDCPCKTEST